MKDDRRKSASAARSAGENLLPNGTLHSVSSPGKFDAAPSSNDHAVHEIRKSTSDDAVSEQPAVSRKDMYKETIAMVKDTLDVAWKVAPVSFLPAALFVWSYLRSIHWTSLFQDSAMSGSGLIFLFIAAMLIAVAVLLQFIAPSLLLISTMWNYRQERTLPKAVPRLFLCATIGWLAGFVLVVELDTSHVWIMFVMAFLAAFSFGIYNGISLDVSQNGGEKFPIHAVHAGGLALAAILALTATSIPLLITLHIAERYADGGWLEKLLVFAVFIGTTAVSLLPAIMYLNARTWRPGFYQPLKLASLGAFLLSYIVVSGAALFVPVSSTVMRLAGIYSNEQQSFQILQPSLTAALDAAGVPTHKGKKTNIATGYVRYGFGGIRLLCRQPFDPSLVSADAIKLAQKNKTPDPTMLAGSGCVQAMSSELRPLRM
ncbi:hypothetical protein [Burkholderia pseudomallei]|uniref:hypothetical protein n=1 Tax=Burkholderia pseudomallei TaxID=28450 RepID=UPI000536D586|nr:hypothetical protein [Burkholderia pseudomallei]KGW65317.1 putative membrane protein [Burkholderia pseudomallei MSHR1029]